MFVTVSYCTLGQSQYWFWHWLSTGVNHREYTYNSLFLRVSGQQRTF